MRTKPYTVRGLKRLKCFCGKQAMHQWYVCADGAWRPICISCDIALNGIVLQFMEDPNVVGKMKKYKKKLEILEKSNAT